MSLSSLYTYTGKGNWSLDAVGGSETNGGDIEVKVPDGSRVEAAYLYTTTYSPNSIPLGVTLQENQKTLALNNSDFHSLGSTPYSLEAYRTDVTSYIRDLVGNGSNTSHLINVQASNYLNTDGFALAVVYSNPNEVNRTIALLDGFSDPSGDKFTLSMDNKNVDPSNFQALMSLGIGFGYQPSDQSSDITVNSRQLTSSAGGQDDGVSSNGGLVTIGGLGDDPSNPADPAAGAGVDPHAVDDELYDLAKGNGESTDPFVKTSDKEVVVETRNPSGDDNIFFAGFNISGLSSVNGSPIAIADQAATNSDSTVQFSPLGNDYDPNNDLISLKTIENIAVTAGNTYLLPSGAKISVQQDGSVTYDPNGVFNGLMQSETAKDTFSYSITDGQKDASTTITVSVTGVDHGNESHVIEGTFRKDTLTGSDIYNDVIYGYRETDLIHGLGGNDTLYGGTSNDTLYGDDGNDLLDGGANKDVLFGGEGNDTLYGGGFNDTLYGGNGNDSLDGGQQDDSIDGGAGNDTLEGGVGNDTLLGGANNDLINSGRGADSAEGGLGNDTITGGTGNDTILGGQGNDSLHGNEDADSIVGGAGNDIIFGDRGGDFLTGGAGADHFVFDAISNSYSKVASGIDTITDFEHGLDLFILTGLKFSGLDTDGGNTEKGELRLAYDAPLNITHIHSDQTGFDIALSGNYANVINNSDFVF